MKVCKYICVIGYVCVLEIAAFLTAGHSCPCLILTTQIQSWVML